MNEMCMSCGCKQVNDDHGDPRNLTMDNLQQAADAAGISVDEAAKNIQASAGEKTPVGAGAAGKGQTDGQARGQQSGYTGQQGGSTGGSQPEGDGQHRGHESESASGQEKPFSEKERTEREF
jgi:hypothetical protein